MQKSKLFVSVLALILLAGNIYFAGKYFAARAELNRSRELLSVKTTNDEVIDFTKLFIEKVLKAKTEVDFETRLNLENSVRNLKDEQILIQWQKFTESQTEAEAQENVKNLLQILADKIKI